MAVVSPCTVICSMLQISDVFLPDESVSISYKHAITHEKGRCCALLKNVNPSKLSCLPV